MNVLDVLRGLGRRWYISIPGLVIAIVAALGMWTVTSSEYERSASQLLLPGVGVLPDGATNQYLYLGGLAPVADVLARAVGSGELVQEYRADGAEVTITRDASATGPVLLLTVRAHSRAEVDQIIDAVLKEATKTLDVLQAEQGVAALDRVTVSTIAIDTEGTVSNRSRVLNAGVAGIGVSLVTIVLASVLDGMSGRRRRRGSGGTERAADAQPVMREPDDDPAAAIDPADDDEYAALTADRHI